jgi:uncharacterized protein (DUF58 family)
LAISKTQQILSNEMLSEVLKKVRKYEIKLRKAITGTTVGEIKSLVKGSGLEFDEVRPYQYGDDVRAIDWNVSAKGLGTYIKTFKEDKDQTVLVLYDLSGSTLVDNLAKSLKIKELAAVLYLSAINQGSSVAYAGFSDNLELVSKASKSRTKAISNVFKMLKFNALEKKTNIGYSLLAASKLLNSRSLVFVISDFIDVDFEQSVKILAKKHELIFIEVKNQASQKNIPLGLIPSRHAETSNLVFTIQSMFKNWGINESKENERIEKLKEIVSKTGIDFISIAENEEYIQPLIAFFRKRLFK